jgi:D-tyrosyl-tRNA(Tyr) deacylase
MRAVLQRVSSAKVTVDGEITGQIGVGLLLYLGCGKEDGDADSVWMLDKVLGLRVFADPASGDPHGKLDKSLIDVGGELLVVSQFTLFADVRRGRRPSFEGAMPPGPAEAAYEAFVRAARERGVTVQTGRFRASMEVSSVGVGPITISLDSRESRGAGA